MTCNTRVEKQASVAHLIYFELVINVAPWCGGYHYYTTSFNKA